MAERTQATARGRVFIRNCGRATGSWGSPSTGGHAYMMVGAIEIPRSFGFGDEVVHDFVVRPGSRASHIEFRDVARPMPEHLSCYDLASCVHDLEWRCNDELSRMMGIGSGGMAIRATRAPASAGSRAMLVLIAMSMPDATLPDGHLAELEILPARGHDGATARLTDYRPCTEIEHVGNAMSSIQKSPLWGLGRELHGFTSTMALKIIDMCSRIDELTASDSDDPAALAEIKRLRQCTGSAIQDQKDPQFAEFKRRLTARFGPTRWDSAPSASEIAKHSAACDEIVREILHA